ncbi:MAG: YdbL family protein [Victivallaceae bacterium]
MNKNFINSSVAFAVALTAAGCIKTQSEVEVKPIEIKPVHVTIDLNVKIDRELDAALAAKPPVANAKTEKDRLMNAVRDRRDKITEYRTKGVFGENNQGLLELRVPPAETTADAVLMMTAENADRAKLYIIIAEEQKTTPDFVATRRAARTAEKAPAGTWLQGIDGVWSKKQ